MEFQTEIDSKDVLIYGTEATYNGDSIKVNWTFSQDLRDWGIKDLSVYVTSIEGEILIEDFDKEDYPEAPSAINFLDWDIETEFKVDDGCPCAIEFDIKEKSIIVS